VKKIRIPMADDAFNDLRKEFNQMLALQLKKGNNGLTKRKFLTFGIYANNLRQAVPRLNHIQTDLINNFRQMAWRPGYWTARSGWKSCTRCSM
jgi:hypothetical protein